MRIGSAPERSALNTAINDDETMIRSLLLSPLLLLFLLLSTAGAWAQQSLRLPELGEEVIWNPAQERRIGQSIAAQIYRDTEYVEDAVLQDYVERQWKPLLEAAKNSGQMSAQLEERFAWQLFLIRQGSINAFALPGGYFGVNLGLISAVESAPELASVLAHEMSHALQRHIARMLQQDKKNMPLLLAGLVLGALAASNSPQAAEALIIGSQAAHLQSQLSFSRDMEREADRVGFNLLGEAGFDQGGAVSMFEKLQHASRLSDSTSWPYLRSHPLTSERIAQMQLRLQSEHFQAAEAKGHSGRVEHALMAARARVLTQPGVDRLRQWTHLDDSALKTADRASQLYAAALAHQRLRQPKEAQARAAQLIQMLESEKSDDSGKSKDLANLLQAELLLETSKAAKALEVLEKIEHQSWRPLQILLARSLIALDSEASDRPARRAANLLEDRLILEPHDAQVWELLARAQSALGERVPALRSEAEARVARLDYEGAVDRLVAAQNLGVANHIDASIIDARLRQVRQLIQEQSESF